LKLALFMFFIGTRALHPMLIDLSKTDGKILYAKNTPIVMNKILTVVLMNVCALVGGGLDGVRLCWQPRCMAVFGLIGAIYALGDFLEMLSMSKMSGGVYQVLLQSKLLITALMCWWLKGSRQSSVQWHVLFAMFLSTSAFVLVDQGSSSSGGPSSLPLFGLVCVLLKVAVSCYCAVLSEKYLKAFSDLPLFAKISGLSTTWALASVLLCGTEPKVVQDGFFAHWDGATVLVTLSFVVKTVSTMYLLQALDSVQKNIGEALAVIVIFLMQVSFMDKAFELSVFLVAVLVVALVKTYLIAPKAQKPKEQPKANKSNKMKLVSVNQEGTPLMQSLGVDTITCEVADKLPAGVFYGMLGGVYPVVGSTNPSSPNRCELISLAHPPVEDGGAGDVVKRKSSSEISAFMPCQSLTVLGHIRDPLPRESLSAAQCMQDVDKARAHLLDRCTATA